ncbi:ABC transporter permease [Saccharopolyspora sp. 5N708]|uniref:ABC transporter permease n=1 Tax=Saccharopolyspora sp. 5N708 TaxID=3457424 RepID=UPI003FD69204
MPLGTIAFAVALWWLLTSVIADDDRLLSSFAPQRAVPAIGDLIARGVLLHDIGSSLWRLLVGILIAAVIGMPLSLAVGSLAAVERATRPVFQFLRMISPLSWAPVAVALFGIGHRPVFFLVAAAAVWPILLGGNRLPPPRGLRPSVCARVCLGRPLAGARRQPLQVLWASPGR